MTGKRLHAAILAAMPCFVGLVAPRRALGDPGADVLTSEGVALRRERRDVEALAVFERALAIDASPRARAQVGLAEHALGFWVEAEKNLSMALSARDVAWIADHGPQLMAALDAVRTHLASLDVRADVDTGAIWIDGVERGPLPLAAPLRVVAGASTLEVRAPGFVTATRVVRLQPYDRARETFTLITSPEPAGSIPPAHSAAREGAANAPHPGWVRTAAIASLAASGALLIGAATTFALRDSYMATYNEDSRCFYGGESRDQRCGGYRDAASMALNLAIVQGGVAAAAAGVSVLFFALPPRPSTNRARLEGCSFGLGAQCTGSF